MGLNFLGAFNGMTVLYIFIALLVFLLMIMIHELGHYTFGRIFKFKINSYIISPILHICFNIGNAIYFLSFVS